MMCEVEDEEKGMMDVSCREGSGKPMCSVIERPERGSERASLPSQHLARPDSACLDVAATFFPWPLPVNWIHTHCSN